MDNESIQDLILWLNDNTVEWSLEVNPHNGYYESKHDYLTRRGMEPEKHYVSISEEELGNAKNLYVVQVYPSTPVTFYLCYHIDLHKALIETKDCVQNHKRGPW